MLYTPIIEKNIQTASLFDMYMAWNFNATLHQIKFSGVTR